MALSNASWGEERIANELLLKLGIEYRPAQYGSTCRNARTDNRVAINVG